MITVKTIVIIDQAEKWTKALMHQNTQSKLKNDKRPMERVSLYLRIDDMNWQLLAQ